MHHVAALLSLVLPLPTAPQTGELAPPNPEFAELSARWRQRIEQEHVPGFAVCIVEGEEILHLETFGVRDPGRDAPVTPDTMFYIASATKPYVAVALAHLAERGELDLDAPVASFLPRFQLAGGEDVTVRDLLCHRAGIQCFPAVFLDAYSGQITEDRYWHFLNQERATGELLYSNLHFTLAGRVLEAVTGKPWKEALDELLFTPLGLEHTTGDADWMYAQDDVAIPSTPAAIGFRPTAVRKSSAVMHAAGGLGTSIHDASRWLRLHVNGGSLGRADLLGAEALEELFLDPAGPRRIDQQGDSYGLGWKRERTHGLPMLQHGGGYIGTASLFSFVPEAGLGVAVLVNSDTAGHPLCERVTQDVYDFLLGDGLSADDLEDHGARLRGIRADEARDGRGSTEPEAGPGRLSLAPGRYVGRYDHPHWGTVVLEESGGRLRGRMGNLSFGLSLREVDRFEAVSRSPVRGPGRFETAREDVRALSLTIGGRTVEFTR